jgi:hypothetical protein
MNLPEIHTPRSSITLPDNDQWTNRFEIRSETSNRIYVIAQHKKKKHWACSCPGWKRYRKCKHLDSIGVPNYEKPYEAVLI